MEPAITSPVYIQQQGTNETNPRYSLIYSWAELLIPDLMSVPYEVDNRLEGVEVVIIREPYWRGTVPNTLPTGIGLLSGQNPDALRGVGTVEASGGGTTPSVTLGAGLNSSKRGLECTVDGTASAVSRVGWVDHYSLKGATQFDSTFYFDPNSLTIGDGDLFIVMQFFSTGGASTSNIYLQLKNTSGQLSLIIFGRDDSGVTVNESTNITDAAHKLRVTWLASSAPGADDGEVKFWIDDVLETTLSGIDSDLQVGDDLYYGFVSSVDVNTIGTLYFDEITAKSTIGGSHEELDISFEHPTDPQGISMVSDNNALTEIYMYDNSATAYSANLVDLTDFPLFEVDGSTPAANDVIYFGSTSLPFHNILLNIGQAGDINGLILSWQYWDGGSWTVITDGGVLESDFDITTGAALLKVAGETDMAAKIVNGDSRYWVRLKIVSVTSWTTSPWQQGSRVKVASEVNNYVEFDANEIKGDAHAKTMIRVYTGPTGYEPVAEVIMGLKTRGLDTFTSFLTAAGANPSGWSENMGTDTSLISYPPGPGGKAAQCTFTGDQTLVERINWLLATANNSADWTGAYRVFCRARQIGGAAGDVSLQLHVNQGGATVAGEIVKMKMTDNRDEIVDLGTFSYMLFPPLGDETADETLLVFYLYAKSDNGATPNLNIFDIVLIPVDEWVLSSQVKGGANAELTNANMLVLDGGVLREAALEMTYHRDKFPIEITTSYSWSVMGELPSLPPNKKGRIYFMLLSNDATDLEREMPTSEMADVEIFTVEQWLSARGSD